jgi:hypothetical protein
MAVPDFVRRIQWHHCGLRSCVNKSTQLHGEGAATIADVLKSYVAIVPQCFMVDYGVARDVGRRQIQCIEVCFVLLFLC